MSQRKGDRDPGRERMTCVSTGGLHGEYCVRDEYGAFLRSKSHFKHMAIAPSGNPDKDQHVRDLHVYLDVDGGDFCACLSRLLGYCFSSRL